MTVLDADMLYLLFDSANMHRWNDHMRPVDLTELDKQAHKAAIAWVLGKFEESAGNPVDWRAVMERTLFSFIQRSVLTDLKPQVFHRITAERSREVNGFVMQELLRLVPDCDPRFIDRMSEYLDSPKDSKEDAIVRAAHYLATRWEFRLIYDSNRSLYGIDRTREEIDREIEQHIDLIGVRKVLATGDAFNFIDLVGQLRFQQRWARTPRIPKTTVLGHSLLVADMMLLHDIDSGADDRKMYNDFYTGLFHDLPEVLTKDVITPIKTSVDGLASLLEEIERDMVESEIMPLLDEGWRQEFGRMVFDPFEDMDDPALGRRDGFGLKSCDLMCAYMEAFISGRYGISSNTLREGEAGIREKLEERGGAIDCRSLLKQFDALKIRWGCSDDPMRWRRTDAGKGPGTRECLRRSVVAVDDLETSHVGPEDLGNGDRSVLVLVVLQDGDHGPGERET